MSKLISEMSQVMRIQGKHGVRIIPETHYGKNDSIECIHLMIACDHGFMSEELTPEDAFRLGNELIRLSGVK